MQIAPKISLQNTFTADYSLQAIDTLLYFTADVLSATDYYPFGMMMVGRNLEGVDYKYGFNGQEKDNEIYGRGNSYTAEFWQYDARLGRRWNVDPVVKYWESPYTCFSGNPVWFVDPNGADTSFAENETRAQFIETYENVTKEIEKFDTKIDYKLTKWHDKGYTRESINKRMSRQIERLNNQRSQLLELKASFDEVINSETLFYYEAKPNPDGIYLSGGGTKYNIDEKRVDIWFYSGNAGTIVHETRHGAGYAWYEWGWNISDNLITNYDYQDEFEAYRAKSIYTRLILKQGGMSKLEIIHDIDQKYKNKKHIIKEFRQFCEP